MIFSELDQQGRSQRWLARRLRDELGEDSGIWEPRLSDWKSGRREMPTEAIECAFRFLGIPDSVLSFFATMSPSSETSSLNRESAVSA